ncbi:MAG TPA: cupin domain-containing protein [Pyrinomonadaceae bacterium]|jgi:quercetin dioxygenase-like cupin family protein|nr:cupin domain-containing protein [Pyrinomonadaceae bacterium]
MSKPILRTTGQGEVWNVLGETIICKVRGAETFGRFAVVEETSPPKGVVPPHFHNQTDEIIYVLEGEYSIECNGKKSVAQTGSVVVIPRGTTHSIRNRLTVPSKMLAIITPSGFENFFAEVNDLKEIEPDKIVEIGKRNDLELVI